MEIIIDGFDFWNMEPMKYWSHSKSYGVERAKAEAKSMVLSEEYIGARKKDGVWAMIIKDKEGNFHLRSRTRNVQGEYADKAEWIPDITNNLIKVPNETVILGEIYKYGDEGSRKATAILNCLKDKSLERQKKTPLHFYVFDILAWEGKSLINTPINDRINYLYHMKANIIEEYIEYASYCLGETLWDTYTDIIAEGGEGIVIQKKSAPYTCGKRTARLSLKMKRELTDTIDAFIDGDYKPATKEYTGKFIETWDFWFNEKTNEKLKGQYFGEYSNGAPLIPITKPYYYGYAGAISFSVMKNGSPEHICWISGVTDEMKKGITQEPEKWINKVYALTAMQVECIDGQYSLRHAKIQEARSDKAAEDCEWSQIANK